MVNGQKVTVFGFGSQGKAQALNLRESGWKVSLFLRPESRRMRDAHKENLSIVTDPVMAAKEADIALLLLPDSAQPEFYREYLEANLPQGASLVFAHGYNIFYKQITPRPDMNVLLVAPSLQGDALRADYLENNKIPILTAVEQDASDMSYRLVEDLAKGIGGKNADILATTFKEETETDLFAEQAVLCGGVTSLMKAGFNTLVHAGYDKKIAYYACVKELKALATLMNAHGLQGFRKRISDTARYGDLTRGPRVIDARVQETLRAILCEITSGDFARELSTEKKAGWPKLANRLEEEDREMIESVRREIDG